MTLNMFPLSIKGIFFNTQIHHSILIRLRAYCSVFLPCVNLPIAPFSLEGNR